MHDRGVIVLSTPLVHHIWPLASWNLVSKGAEETRVWTDIVVYPNLGISIISGLFVVKAQSVHRFVESCFNTSGAPLVNEADILVSGITTLANRQMMLQTEYTKNEKRVLSATDAALKAKTKADKANTELYQLNNGFKNVSGTLTVKSGTIGGAKNLALDLQERANKLSNQASNKLEYLTGD